MTSEHPLEWLSEELNLLLPSPARGVVLFGSAVMLLHGIRDEIGDVDLFVTRDAWSAITVKHPGRWRVQFPTVGDPPLLEWTGGLLTVHAFERWTRRDWWINVQEVWDRRQIVNGWPCVPLEVVRRWKVQAHKFNPGSGVHEKHLRDVELIDAYLAEQAAAREAQKAPEPEPEPGPDVVQEAGERWGV